MDDKRYAVLIDSDNISSKYISNILDEMTKYGVWCADSDYDAKASQH